MKKLISLCKNTKFNALDKKLQNFPLFKFIILILNMSELENINQTENINEVITDTSIENANVKEIKNNIKSNKSEISNGKKRIKLNRLATKEELIKFNNLKYDMSVPDKQNFFFYLKKTLVDYSKELFNISNRSQQKYKTRDILNVFFKLINICQLPLSQLIEIANKKNELRGDFSDRLFIKWLDIPLDSPLVEKYRKTKQYPEVKDEETKETHTRFILNKLVRNKCLEIYKKDNIIPNFEYLDTKKLTLVLKKKLLEEAKEVYREKENLYEELADVYTVLKYLLEYYNIKMDILKSTTPTEYFYIEYLYCGENTELFQYFKSSGYIIENIVA